MFGTRVGLTPSTLLIYHILDPVLILGASSTSGTSQPWQFNKCPVPSLDSPIARDSISNRVKCVCGKIPHTGRENKCNCKDENYSSHRIWFLKCQSFHLPINSARPSSIRSPKAYITSSSICARVFSFHLLQISFSFSS